MSCQHPQLALNLGKQSTFMRRGVPPSGKWKITRTTTYDDRRSLDETSLGMSWAPVRINLAAQRARAIKCRAGFFKTTELPTLWGLEGLRLSNLEVRFDSSVFLG